VLTGGWKQTNCRRRLNVSSMVAVHKICHSRRLGCNAAAVTMSTREQSRRFCRRHAGLLRTCIFDDLVGQPTTVAFVTRTFVLVVGLFHQKWPRHYQQSAGVIVNVFTRATAEQSAVDANTCRLMNRAKGKLLTAGVPAPGALAFLARVRRKLFAAGRAVAVVQPFVRHGGRRLSAAVATKR